MNGLFCVSLNQLTQVSHVFCLPVISLVEEQDLLVSDVLQKSLPTTGSMGRLAKQSLSDTVRAASRRKIFKRLVSERMPSTAQLQKDQRFLTYLESAEDEKQDVLSDDGDDFLVLGETAKPARIKKNKRYATRT